MVGPGYGPVDPNIQATVPAVTMALKHIGLFVEQVRITAIERDFILDVFNKLRVMEMKPASARATVGHEDLVFKMSKTMPAIADTSLQDYIEAEQAVERIRDSYADYFSRYNAPITHVLPIAAHGHCVAEFTINGQTVDAAYLQRVTMPLSVANLPGVAMRFGTIKEGLLIKVQIVGNWQEKSIILHVAALLESVSAVPNLHPALSQ